MDSAANSTQQRKYRKGPLTHCTLYQCWTVALRSTYEKGCFRLRFRIDWRLRTLTLICDPNPNKLSCLYRVEALCASSWNYCPLLRPQVFGTLCSKAAEIQRHCHNLNQLSCHRQTCLSASMLKFTLRRNNVNLSSSLCKRIKSCNQGERSSNRQQLLYQAGKLHQAPPIGRIPAQCRSHGLGSLAACRGSPLGTGLSLPCTMLRAMSSGGSKLG
mmetsp:Transcript_13554/g.28875  ORF Transcript_13554/g.28875 Transcript_13554/m.28875 type:complete len:215 (-) Transcript_13554:30-674(-)